MTSSPETPRDREPAQEPTQQPEHPHARDAASATGAEQTPAPQRPASKAGGRPTIGLRNTWQRAAVIEVLGGLSTFASAQDIHSRLAESGTKVALTTVYRTLQNLSEVGAVDTLQDASGETLYRSCASQDHHHHLVCTRCRATVEIDGGPVEQWATRTASTHGFRKTGHLAEIFGLCEQCRED